MTNPYATPNANLARDEPGRGIESFPRFSAWYVFGLIILTLSLYIAYWLFTRTRTLNKLSANKISTLFCYVTMAFFLLSLATAFGEVALALTADTLEGSTVSRNYAIFSNLISFISNILMLVWVFKFRNRLADNVIGGLSGRAAVGPVMTFFFQVIYLQYKINERIDAVHASA